MTPGVPSAHLKICGLTNPDDARLALQPGVHALGFNFFPRSKRALTLADLDWIASLPRTAQFVAVVVEPPPDLLHALVQSACFDFIQFHGEESPAACADCPLPWIKAWPVRSAPDLERLTAYATPWLLLDAPAPPGEYGGTGHPANWSLAADFIATHPEKKILLAGGIHPGNARAALAATRAFGLDLASGVESSPRQKDPVKIKALLQALA